MSSDKWKQEYIKEYWQRFVSKAEIAKYLLDGIRCPTCKWCFSLSNTDYVKRCVLRMNLLLDDVAYTLKHNCKDYKAREAQ